MTILWLFIWEVGIIGAYPKNYEENRDLLTEMLYKRNTVEVTKRSYTYDNLARPVTRVTQREGSSAVTDSFAYNGRSELSTATVNGGAYGYAYDNIGNRKTANRLEETISYTADSTNRYTSITVGEASSFTPNYDPVGNQMRVKTSTGTWLAIHNAENRPASFLCSELGALIECSYDYMGRRVSKNVRTSGTDSKHLYYIYHGYLQIGAYDVDTGEFDYFLLWDPTEPVATRPLAIRKGADWYAYGIDLTKNVCELFDSAGAIATRYDYTPFGEVTATGDVTQPIQWSSEYADTDLGLVYYNYRHYNPTDGRWISKDPIGEKGGWNLYGFVGNRVSIRTDFMGKLPHDIFLFTQSRLKKRKVYGFFDPDSTKHPYGLRKEYIDKVYNVVKEYNDYTDKKGCKCFSIEIFTEALSYVGVIKLPYYFDRVLLLSHSEGYPDFYHIEFYEDDKVLKLYSPELRALKTEVIGCHLAGIHGRRIGGKHTILSYVDTFNIVVKKIRELKKEEKCTRVVRILIATNNK